jgi:hypothetical protein
LVAIDKSLVPLSPTNNWIFCAVVGVLCTPQRDIEFWKTTTTG